MSLIGYLLIYQCTKCIAYKLYLLEEESDY